MVLGVESTTIVLLEASERVFLFLLASGREEPIMGGVLGSSWGIVHIGKSTCTALRYAVQVFCGRLGMHSIIGTCGPCSRRYSR